MKLISMHIDNFGGLHDYDYDFDDGLNVILQDNGWGKTTMAAFLKAMMYGYDAKRSRDITENERKRYYPWQGGKYGGTLDFEADGTRYRINRTFGETPRFDTVKIINLDTETTARIPADKIGETLFHLDANAFQRSVFINQNGLTIDGAASSIHTRLNALLSQANDVAAYDSAIASLTQEIKVYEKTGGRGQLGEINRQINTLEYTRSEQERSISEQDAARKRISEIDNLITSVNKKLEEKNKVLDSVSGEEKRREAAKKLIADIDQQMNTLQEQINLIIKELGGTVPSQTEIDQVKRQVQVSSSLNELIGEYESLIRKLKEEYSTLLEEYHGSLPESSQLDGIQRIYGEMQGILSSEETDTSNEDIPEDYVVIKAAAENDSEYISRLQNAVRSQTDLQTLIRRVDDENRELKSDAAAWEEKRKRFTSLKDEIRQSQAAVKEVEAYAPEKAGPAIKELEELQKKQQTAELKREALNTELLTAEQEELLRQNTGELPDSSEGKEILGKLRISTKKRAEAEGLKARLDGETAKAESISASLKQYDAVKPIDTSKPDEPKKSSGTVLIGIGAVAAAAGVLLGIFAMPALFVVAAVGLVLAATGIAGNNNYKKSVEAYNEWKSVYAKNQEELAKKEELLNQQKAVQESIDALQKQIAECEKELDASESEVSAWFDKWGNGEEEHSEASLFAIIENAQTIGKLRKKQANNDSINNSIKDDMYAVAAEIAKIKANYPECADMPIREMAEFLRERQNTYRIADSHLQTVLQNEKTFVAESGNSMEELESEMSPRTKELTEKRDKTAVEIQHLQTAANKELAALGLDTDQEHLVKALREAEEMLNEYKQYESKLKDQSERQSRKEQQKKELQRQLEEALVILSDRYADHKVPERLSLVRNEIIKADQIKSRISNSENDLKIQKDNLAATDQAITEFKNKYGKFASENEDVLPLIYEKSAKYAELTAAGKQLEKQKASVGEAHPDDPDQKTDEREAVLKAEIDRLKEERDNLLIEYTQKADYIRQADQALEMYPDTVRELHELYEQKQQIQNQLSTLKKAIQLITNAKENLADRYLSKVEDRFNNYMHVWLNNDTVRGILDIDFNVAIEENDKVHVAEGYSTGYCDLIDFCMRLSLVDTLFENEQPFLILDDPFVNLDADRLEKALELLGVMAADKQIVYFVCHPIRAVETDENSMSRTEFLKLAEATKQTISQHQMASVQKKNVRKSPKEMYKVSESARIPFKPADPDFTITNNIFSMNFVPDGPETMKDTSYELFFIDAAGHVLNDRQIIEVNNGKLSSERVQFSLNTRDDSGNEFELMVREHGQDDYDIAARFPFRANLAFTGTFSFDF